MAVSSTDRRQWADGTLRADFFLTDHTYEIVATNFNRARAIAGNPTWAEQTFGFNGSRVFTGFPAFVFFFFFRTPFVLFSEHPLYFFFILVTNSSSAKS
jgi:hypothetical protein